MKFEELTLKSQELFQSAHDLAGKMNHQAIEPIHFLNAMFGDDQGVVLSILRKIGVQTQALKKDVTADLDKLVAVTGVTKRYLSQESRKMLDLAFAEARKMKDQYTSLEHILLGMILVKGRVASLLNHHGVTKEAIFSVLKDIRGNQSVVDQNPEEKYQALEKFGRDLTSLAQRGKLDPVIGRDEEIRRIMQVSEDGKTIRSSLANQGWEKPLL